MSSVRKVRLDSSVKRAKQDRTPHVRRPCPRQPFTMTQAADFVESHPLGTREKSESGAKTRCTEQNRCCSTLCQSRGRRASEGQSSAKQRRKRNHGTRGSRALVILSHSTQSAFPHLPRHSEVASSLVIRQCPPPPLAPREPEEKTRRTSCLCHTGTFKTLLTSISLRSHPSAE